MTFAAHILAFKVPYFFFVVERNQGCAQRSITAVVLQPLQRLIDIEGLGLRFEELFVAFNQFMTDSVPPQPKVISQRVAGQPSFAQV